MATKGKTVKSLPRVKVIDDSTTIRCPMCGERKAFSNFYKSTSAIYANNNNLMCFCKNCVAITYDTYFNLLKDIRNSVYITCMKFDIPFSEVNYDGMTKQVINDVNAHPFKIYMQKVNSLGSWNGDLSGFDPKFLLNQDITSKEDIISGLEAGVAAISVDVQLTEQDIEVKNDVIRLIGYDPFAGYCSFDQKFLYNECITYLDEDTLDDAFKLSQILQIVNNNNQIRKIDLVIASLSNDTKELVANQGAIKSLSSTKKDIVVNTDKIAKENSISVKNRGDKSAGKSTLTYLMKQYRELGFEDAEQDYYDQNKAIGMKAVADISNSSMLDQLKFDENDINDMFFTQRQMLKDLQDKVMDLEEENRQLHVKISTMSEVT